MLLVCILVLNFAVLAALGGLLWQLRRKVAALEQQTAPMGSSAAAPKNIPIGQPEFFTIEILNPMQLAAKESWVAGALGNLAPSVVRRIVHRRAQKIIEDQLQAHGVEAEVKLRRVA